MSLDFLDTYEKYVHEDVKADVSADTELFKLDKVEETQTQTQTKQETPSSNLSDEDIERIAKKLAEMQTNTSKVIENEIKEDEQNG